MTTPSPKHVDALIVGAGPSGLTLGICLLQQGKSVLIAEKHVSGLSFSRAVLINADTLRRLEPYGISAALREKGLAVDGLSIFINDQVVSSAHFDLQTANPFHPLCLPQLDTEACLSDLFLKAGGEIMRGYAFDAAALIENPDHCRSTLISQTDPSQRFMIQSSWLLGCDGFHSSLREKLGIAYPGSIEEKPGYSFDVAIQAWPFPTAVNVWLSPNGGGLAIKLSATKVRLVGTTRPLCDLLFSKFTVTAILSETTFPMHYHVAETYGAGRIWLAGDAVHVHSPIGGRGMNMGMVDALELALALQTETFNHYQTTRLAIARAWVAKNRFITQRVMRQTRLAQLFKRGFLGCFRVTAKLLGPKLAQAAFENLTTSTVTLKDKKPK